MGLVLSDLRKDDSPGVNAREVAGISRSQWSNNELCSLSVRVESDTSSRAVGAHILVEATR